MRRRTAIVLAAAASGLPSTAVAITRGGPVLDSTRAAGTMLVGEAAPSTTRLVAGVLTHGGISTFWGAILWRVLPRRHAPAWGAVAGLGIAALDFGLIGRRFPAVHRLPLAPQIADHLAFGLIIGLCRTAGTLADL